MPTVMVVDDDQMIREIAQLSLEMVGWTVITASDGKEALSVAAAERPDAILMDVMMPVMDGPTACRRLAESQETARIPIILFTAKVQRSECHEWENLPVVGMLAKPFDPVRLADDVGALLGW